MILVNQLGFAQNYPGFSKYWGPIHEEFNKQNYYAAYDLILQALPYKQQTDSLTYLAATATRKLNAYSKSESYYKSLLKTELEQRHPDINFYLAEVLYSLGRYSDAEVYYNTYLAAAEDTSPEVDIAKKRLVQLKWAKEHIKIKNPLLKLKKLEEGINTKDNESSPKIIDGSVYYSSLKSSEFEKGKLKSEILKFNETTIVKEPIDSGLLDQNALIANPSFSDDRKMFVYNICREMDGTSELICDVYMKIKEDASWSKGIKLPATVNSPNYTSTHPCIAKDPITELYKLYFISNRPNGKGGYDIWSTYVDETGQTTELENVDFANTEENEFAPYYSSKTKTLYFSSNGFNGFGGQDIFKYSWKGQDSLKVVNLGASINSSYDDLHYSTNNLDTKAYMVSNRPGSIYLDDVMQACCYDIYKVGITPATIELFVTTKDAYDSTMLGQVKLNLYDITEGDSLVQVVTVDEKSISNFKLIEGRMYKIIATKEAYIGDSINISTIDLPDFKPIKRDVYLIQKKQLNVLTFERTTNVNLKGVTVQLWNTDRNQMIREVTNPDSNFFNFELLKGVNYKLLATKNKYESAEAILLAKDISGELIINRKLFLELTAIAELRRLLPIKLFFDNDLPDPRSSSDTTNVLFSKIYNDYVAKKGKYMSEFTSNLKGPKKDKAILEIDTFFEKDVKLNGDKLHLFMDKLLIVVQEGHSIDIFLKGYASPRAKSDYNQLLSSRRVSSIRNEFNVYQNAAFQPFIVSENLKIKQIPFGESQSNADVSDNLEDVRNSIYNLKAAFERRVEILEILKGVDDK